MKRILFLTISYFLIQQILGQNLPSVSNDNIYNTTSIEFEPEYPGGMGEFYKFIGANYKVPTSKDFLGGKVYVTFIIENDGSVSDIKILRDAGCGTGKEAIRVLELSPKWSPGRQNGKNVRC
jgi:periplasmic protein TonB